MKSFLLLGMLIAELFTFSCKRDSNSGVREFEGLHEPQKGWMGAMGLLLSDKPGIKGAFVEDVNPFSYADVILIRANDVLTKVNGKDIASVADFVRVTTETDTNLLDQWRFTIARGGSQTDITNLPAYPCNPTVLALCGPLPAHRLPTARL